MRVTTALIALLSVLSAPTVSALCKNCCQRPLEHQLAVCHNQAHASLGPHMHHMNHVHMVTQESDANAVVQRCQHQLQDGRVSCQTAACLSARPIQTSAASADAVQLRLASQLIATTIVSSPAISGPLLPPAACRLAISSYQSASVPLRI